MWRRSDSPSAAAPRLFFNGKFYAGATNGVHRVADRLLRELDAQAMRGEAPARWDMRLPLPACTNWAPDFASIRKLPQRAGHTQAWEQLVLPVVARGGVLACLANLAPALHPAKLTMIHDAQFRLSPESYPPRLRWGYRALIPMGGRTSRTVATVSDYARDSLATFGLAARADTHVVHNGADHMLEVAADHGILHAHGIDRPYALLFGSAARYKNIAVAFAAWQAPALAGMKLVIVGPARAALVAAGLSPPDAAVFVGGVDDAGLRALYEHAHCLLYPSRTEGFGLPPVEAMLCGCPVVAAPAGAMPEVCRDAPLYAGMDAPSEWVDAVLALRDPAVRAARIAAGRARAAPFTWAAAGAKMARLLGQLLEPAR